MTESIDIPANSFTKNVEMDGQIDLGDGAKQIDPKNEILADSIVKLHVTVRELNTKLMRQAKKYNFITPRDFLDFIRHFIDLRTEKKSELVELQSHLKMGLDKLKESEDEVV